MSRTVIRNATAVCVDALDIVVHGATIVIDDGVLTEIAAAVEVDRSIGVTGAPDHEIDADGGIVDFLGDGV